MWSAARAAACLLGVETGVGKERGGGLCLSGNKPDTLGDAPRPPGSDVVLALSHVSSLVAEPRPGGAQQESPQPSALRPPFPAAPTGMLPSDIGRCVWNGFWLWHSELSAAGVPPGRSCQQVRGTEWGPHGLFYWPLPRFDNFLTTLSKVPHLGLLVCRQG